MADVPPYTLSLSLCLDCSLGHIAAFLLLFRVGTMARDSVGGSGRGGTAERLYPSKEAHDLQVL